MKWLTLILSLSRHLGYVREQTHWCIYNFNILYLQYPVLIFCKIFRIARVIKALNLRWYTHQWWYNHDDLSCWWDCGQKQTGVYGWKKTMDICKNSIEINKWNWAWEIMHHTHAHLINWVSSATLRSLLFVFTPHILSNCLVIPPLLVQFYVPSFWCCCHLGSYSPLSPIVHCHNVCLVHYPTCT